MTHAKYYLFALLVAVIEGTDEVVLFFESMEVATVSSVSDNKMEDSARRIKTETFLWVFRDIVDSSVRVNFTTTEFNLKSVYGSIWKISLHNDGSSIELKLTLTNYANFLQASFSACALDPEMIGKYERKATQLFHGICYNYLSFKPFLPLSSNLENFKTLLHRGDLILLGTITVFQNEMENIILDPEVENYYSRNMRCLLKHGTYADFTIKVHEKEFHCHKCVLAFRSSYFEALFRCDMEEKKSNVLVLQDIEPDVFQQVLEYIYSMELDISESNVVQLLSAAEKYLLSGLKQKCEEMLFDYFSYSTLPTIAVIADKFQLHDLKLRVIYMYAMFMKQVQANIDHARVKEQHTLPAICDNANTSTSTFKKAKFPLHSRIESACFPPATVWVATYRNLILDCRVRLELNEGTKSTEVSIKNEKFNVSFQMTHYLRRIFNQSTNNYSGSLAIYFCLVSAKKKKIPMRFQVSFINTSQAEMYKNTISVECELGQNLLIFNLNVDTTTCLHGGKNVIVKCKSWIEECSIHYLTESDQSKTTAMNLTSMNAIASFTDMVVKVKDTEFPCHRAIVASQSSVLAEMIETNTSDGVLELSDIEPETFRNILEYIYANDYKLQKVEAVELLPLSCQFKLDHLKSMCERTLALSLTVENAVDIYILSVLYSSSILKKCASHFVRQYLHDILAIPEFVEKLQKTDLSGIVSGFS